MKSNEETLSKITVKIRLLSYSNAVRVTNYANKLGAVAHLSTGSISIQGSQEQIESVIDLLDEESLTHELTVIK